MYFFSPPYLKDKRFLKKIDELPLTIKYCKITLLNWSEQPLQEIQGKIVSGNISINGDSSVRRTANLETFVEEDSYDYSVINSLFSLNKKITLEIGIKNTTNEYSDYPIIWFPQGLFVIMGLSLNHSMQGTTINLDLKDKMVLLNGECGGQLPAAVLFNEIEYMEDSSEVEKPTLYTLIYEAVNHYGGIDETKIIINDISNEIPQVMRWGGDFPIYQTVSYKDNQISYVYSEKETEGATTIVYGDDIGYINVPFTYPDELVGQPGENVCTVLDKIKQLLTNYEYFFDLWGNFVFQEKKNYLNIRQTSFQLEYKKEAFNSETGEIKKTPTTKDYFEALTIEDYLINNNAGLNTYNLNNSKLITSISNTPKYENIKNDFIIWGKRKELDGTEVSIRYHLAIDKKPKNYRNMPVKLIFYTDEYNTELAKIDDGESSLKEGETRGEININDWRTELYIQGLEADYSRTKNYADYYIELMNEWQKIYDLKKADYKEEIKQRPQQLEYYLDIIDEDSIIGQYSIDNIGKRSYVIVDDSINCLFEPDVPPVVCIERGEDTEKKINACIAKGQNYTVLSSDIYHGLIIGGVYNSAFIAMKDLLYQYTNYNETISISMVPVFHLDTNTRISILDLESGTNGDFIITSLSIPLDTQSTMSISAIKALEKI